MPTTATTPGPAGKRLQEGRPAGAVPATPPGPLGRAFGLPPVLTITMMPLTYRIADGVGAGFMSYVALRVAKGEARTVHPLLYVFTGIFAFFFFVPLLQRLLAA